MQFTQRARGHQPQYKKYLRFQQSQEILGSNPISPSLNLSIMAIPSLLIWQSPSQLRLMRKNVLANPVRYSKAATKRVCSLENLLQHQRTHASGARPKRRMKGLGPCCHHPKSEPPAANPPPRYHLQLLLLPRESAPVILTPPPTTILLSPLPRSAPQAPNWRRKLVRPHPCHY